MISFRAMISSYIMLTVTYTFVQYPVEKSNTIIRVLVWHLQKTPVMDGYQVSRKPMVHHNRYFLNDVFLGINNFSKI